VGQKLVRLTTPRGAQRSRQTLDLMLDPSLHLRDNRAEKTNALHSRRCHHSGAGFDPSYTTNPSDARKTKLGAISSGWPGRPRVTSEPNVSTSFAGNVDGMSGVQIGPPRHHRRESPFRRALTKENAKATIAPSWSRNNRANVRAPFLRGNGGGVDNHDVLLEMLHRGFG